MPDSFSVQLPTAQQGKQIIGPIGTRGGFLGGLASFASDLVNADVHRTNQRDTNRRQDREERIATALDETAQVAFDWQTEQTARLRGGTPDTTGPAPGVTPIPEAVRVTVSGLPAIDGADTQANPRGFEDGSVPADVSNAASSLGLIQSAVRQGRQSPAVFDMNMESQIAALYQRYPEARSEIATYLQARGLDHYLFRELTQAREDADAQATATRAQETTLASLAISNGVISPDAPWDQRVEAGRQLALAQSQYEAARRRVQQQTDDANLSTAQRTARQGARTEASETGVTAIITIADQYIGSIMERVNILAGSGNPEALTRLGNLGPSIMATINNGRQTAHANARALNATPEQHAEIDRQFDMYREGWNQVFTGDASMVQTQIRTLNGINASMGLRGARQMEMYTLMSRTFGRETVNQMFNGNPAASLPENIQEQLRNEVQRFQLAPPGSTSAMVTMSNIANLLEGNSRLANIPESQRVGTLQTLVPVVQNGVVATVTAGPRATQQQLTYSVNGIANIVDAASSFTSGTQHHSSVYQASAFMGNPSVAGALELAIRNPQLATEATATMVATRATSARLFDIVRTRAGTLRDPTGVLQVQYNASSHRWEVQGTRQRYAAYVENHNRNNRVPTGQGGRLGTQVPGTGPMTYEQVLQSNRGTNELQAAADALNRNLDLLSGTISHDLQAPLRTLSPAQARDFYSNGTLPPSVQQAMVAQRTADAAPERALDQLERDIREAPARLAVQPETRRNNPAIPQVYSGLVTSAAQAHNVPPEIINFTISNESGWDPGVQGRGNDSGEVPNVLGLGQFLVPEAAARGMTLAATRRGSAAARYGLIDVDDSGRVTRDDRTNPQMSIVATTRYLADLYRQNGNDWTRALEAYGVLNPRNWRQAGGRSSPRYQQLHSQLTGILSGLNAPAEGSTSRPQR